MAAEAYILYKNDGTETYTVSTSIVFMSATAMSWTYEDHIFLHWNTQSDDSGSSYNAGDYYDSSYGTVFYAIWEEAPHEVTIAYKGSTIATMDASGTKTLKTAGKYCEGDIEVEYTRPSAPQPTLQSKTVSPSLSQQTVSPDSGYDGLSQVTVNAMPSGSAGTPTATKGTVSNHSISVTPTVTNTTGYITGGTINGTAVTVSASELVSGTKSITENGTGIDVTNYASVDVNVSGGGVDTLADFIENRNTYTSYENSSISKIDAYVFYSCANLTTVSFPSCTSIGNYAFYKCSKLTTVSFPLCTSIGNNAFDACSKLTTVSFPSCTSIGSYAFDNCYSLSTVNFPLCSYIGANAFYYCSKLTTVSFPSCTSIGSNAFNTCRNLTTVSFPLCTSIGSDAFTGCYNLTTVSFPSCTSIGRSAFYNCYGLTTLSFPLCSYISGSAFTRCFNLTSLYLLASSIVSLAHSNAFSSTPIGGYTASTGGVYGSIFVPASLYSSYTVGTNWSYFSSRFVSV